MLKLSKNLLSFSLICASIFSSCGRPAAKSTLDFNPLTKDQALSELDDIVFKMKEFYGPLEYKATHPMVHFNLVTEVASTRAKVEAAKSDAEIFGAFSQLIRSLRDGHTSMRFPINDNHIVKYSVPVFVMPIKDSNGEWRAVVDSVGPEIADSGIKQGDVITEVDGKPIFDYLPVIQSYKSSGNDVTDRHYIFKALQRDFFMTDLIPSKPLVNLTFISAGQEASPKFASLTWTVEYNNSYLNDVVKPGLGHDLIADMSGRDQQISDASLQKMGAFSPFFATDEVKSKFKFRIRKPSAESLKQFGVEEKDAAPIFAATYEYKGKDILLIRQAGYSPPIPGGSTEIEVALATIAKWIGTYKAILSENSDVDVVVIDQTHNPGGTSSYAFDFFRLFITSPKANLIQRNNVDRKWVLDLATDAASLEKLGMVADARRYRGFAKMIEKSSERGDLLSDPITFDYDFMLNPHKDFSWTKPVLMLADELAGSCGDIGPMLMQRNGVAKVFGERTMGLGGNVEAFTLTSSMATLRLTRGLYTTYRADSHYTEDQYIENNGVTPDIHFEHTLSDYRAGFVGYVQAFSDAAVAEVK